MSKYRNLHDAIKWAEHVRATDTTSHVWVIESPTREGSIFYVEIDDAPFIRSWEAARWHNGKMLEES